MRASFFAGMAVFFVVGACGNDTTGGDYGLGDGGPGPQVPAHTLATQSDGVTAFVRMTGQQVLRTDGTISSTDTANITFFSPAADLTLVPATMGTCDATTSITTSSRSNGIALDVGSEVFLSATAGDFTLAFDILLDSYTGYWDPDTEGAPWVPRSWYALEARAPSTPFRIEDAVGIPARRLAITSPHAGDSVSLTSDLTVTWEPGDESAVVYIQVNRGMDGVVCATTDTGSFTVPASILATIPLSVNAPSVMVHRYYSWRMERASEVVHLLANETTIVNVFD